MRFYPRDDGDERSNRQVAAIIPYCAGERGVDIGCGTYKTHPRAIGVDRNPFVRPDLVCHGARLPFPDGTADFVTAVHSVEYFWDTEAALREWLRVLRPGGHLAMVLFDRRCLPPLVIGHPDLDPCFRHTFAPDEFRALVEALPGVAVVQHDTIRDGHSFDTVLRKEGDGEAGPGPARPMARGAARAERGRCLRVLFCNDGHTGSTGDYYIKVLEEMGHQVVTAGWKRDIAPAERTVPLRSLLERCAQVGFVPDLVIEHESGLTVTDLKGVAPCPTVWIEADTPQHHEWHARRAAWFDYVFISQKDWVPYFRSRGNPNTWWLPFACDPGVHRPIACPEAYDLAFVGHLFPPLYAERARLLERLAARYRVKVASNVGYDEMARIYSQARIVFNKTVLGICNIRPFEGMSYGRLVFTDRVGNGLLDLFQDRVHLVIYDESNLERLVDYYLRHGAEREAIARRGREEVHAKHTYAHRVRFILETVFGAPGGAAHEG